MLITTDDVIVDSTSSLFCSACTEHIEFEQDPEGEDVAMSAKEAYDAAAAHVREKHRS